MRISPIHLYISAALVALAALAFGPQPAQAAVTEAWVHRYSNVVSNANDLASKVVTDASGDFIVTGTTDGDTSGRDMLTVKYSGVDGSVIWQQSYNGPANSDDVPTALAVDGNGNVVVTGSSQNAPLGGWFNLYADYYTAKYAAVDGALLWEKRYNGPANGSDQATALALDRGGNVVVTGLSYNESNNDTDYYTAKYAAADGALLWERRYNRPGSTFDYVPPAMAVDGGDNVVVTGYSLLETEGNFHPAIYTVKYAGANGALIWEKLGPVGFGNSVAVDGSGNVVVTGHSNNASDDYYTAKYAAADGALLWEKRYNSPANLDDIPTAMGVDGSGNVVVTGYSNDGAPNYDTDYYTAKYAAADGALLWEKRYNGPANKGDFAIAVAVDGSGNVVVTGHSNNASDYDTDYYTAKYAAADGALLWEKRYKGPANGNDIAAAVALDASGNVVVTGYSWNSRNSDYYTAKYAAATGAQVWEKRYDGNGTKSTSSYPGAVAVDGSGNVMVTGSSDGGASGDDYYTAKYAAANGALLWEKRYSGPANREDAATAMSVDASGNVIVTGNSDNGTDFDYYTAKYAALDGALLWEKRYNGGADIDDRALAVVVDRSGNVVVTGNSDNGINGNSYTVKYAAADGALLWEKLRPGIGIQVTTESSGNVVVTGYSWNGGTSPDYYTAKYAAADGALLWEHRYNGPANREDIGTAVAVDASGNVVVTGNSDNGTDFDYYTAKYAALDGALLWEKRYNGPANGNDEATGVAVDRGGNVLVTGYSSNGRNTDYYTAKYAAADGTLLWEKRYNGVANDYDYALQVALDDSDNVVVTGTSDSGGNGDYYTAKYAAADGALLWEKRYNAPANGDDQVGRRSLALAPNGMVVVTGGSSLASGLWAYATVVYREALSTVAIAPMLSGLRLSFTGTAGHSYSIQRASAITGPWSTLATPTTPASGFLEYLDVNPPAGAAFYRTREP